MWRVAADEEVYKPKMDVSVVSPWNMKSDEANLFDNRARDLAKHEAIYGESDHSKPYKYWDQKGKNELAAKLSGQSTEYKDLLIQHVNKIKPAYHQSPDVPLAVAGNKDTYDPKPYPVLDRVRKETEAKDMINARSGEEIKLLQGQHRSAEA